MELFDYINTYPNWKEILSDKPCSLIIKEKGEFIILNYNQIESDMSIKIVQQARGIIFQRESDGSYKIVCRAFDKFFNYGENNAHKLDEKSLVFQEKIDGCCDEKTLLHTDKGLICIKEIIENYNLYKVLSYNHILNKQEYVKIKGISIQDNNNDWYKVELTDNSSIVLTGSHKIWLPELNCYRQVQDLEGGEDILLQKD